MKVAIAKLELAARDFFSNPADHAPLGLIVVIVLALFIGVLDNFLGPVSSGYAHIAVR